MNIRPATVKDAPLIAWVVLTALDLDVSDPGPTASSCADEKSLYSWRNTLVAEDDSGRPIGAIISYPGDDYMRMREYTWPSLWTDIDPEAIRNTPREALPGEFYLDSMAILPEARGNGLGKQLMLAAMERGRRLGYDRFALIVDVDKPHLRDYYASLGFRPAGPLRFITHDFTKMTLP